MPAQPDMNNISIEESKFLGGDLEHTHLVKGLDFALLQKVLTPPLGTCGEYKVEGTCIL